MGGVLPERSAEQRATSMAARPSKVFHVSCGLGCSGWPPSNFHPRILSTESHSGGTGGGVGMD